MPLFGVSRKKLCGTEQKLKGFKNHETSAQKLSLMSNIQCYLIPLDIGAFFAYFQE